MKFNTASDLDLLYEDLVSAKSTFLRERGWNESCDWPGCLWLWSKALPDDLTVACTMETAMNFERCIEADEEQDSGVVGEFEDYEPEF